MPRGSRQLVRTSKTNHAQHNRKKRLPRLAMAGNVPALADADTRPSVDLTELRSRHVEITDQQAMLAIALTIEGLTPQQCEGQYRWPIEWCLAQIAKPSFAAFMQELGMVALGAEAQRARLVMSRLMTSARSSYVRYAAAQDIMDRAGLRAKPQAAAPAAASISINIGVAAAQPSTVTIENEGPLALDPSSSETV